MTSFYAALLCRSLVLPTTAAPGSGTQKATCLRNPATPRSFSPLRRPNVVRASRLAEMPRWLTANRGRRDACPWNWDIFAKKSQRDFAPKPRVARHELPWVSGRPTLQPQRGCGRTQAEWGKELERVSNSWLQEQVVEFAGFEWQGPFADFSVSQSNRAQVKDDIARPEEHHRKMSFQFEWRAPAQTPRRMG